ncbi:hypothetical protein X975_18368, partial [Stegodyphus mimosarum]
MGLLFLMMFLTASCVFAEETSASESSEESPFPNSEETNGFDIPHRFYSGANRIIDPLGKRALSFFAHWKPYYSGVPAINTRSDIVTAVTRGGHTRPLGQPLRWG